jgi:hypothetical protein
MKKRNSSRSAFHISSKIISRRLKITGGLRIARHTIRHNLSRLLSLQNVKYVTIGWKKVGGERTSRAAVKVYVYSKVEDVAPAHRIPCRLRARDANGRKLRFYIPTDVSEEPGHSTLLQDLQGGDRVLHIGAGTIAFSYHTNNNKRFFLTNAHVVSRVNGASSVAPVIYLNADGMQHTVGRVEKFSPLLGNGVLNTMDAASVAVGEGVHGVEWKVRDLDGDIRGRQRLRGGDLGQYSYLSGGERVNAENPEFVGQSLALLFDGTVIQYGQFFVLDVVAGPRPRSGHSGALLVRRGSGSEAGPIYMAAGLVFGTNLPQGTRLYVFDLKRALDFLHPE